MIRELVDGVSECCRGCMCGEEDDEDRYKSMWGRAGELSVLEWL